MDPNANLKQQRALAARDWTGKDEHELTPAEIAELLDAHTRLSELVESLDQWITRGGFLPTAWKGAR